MDVLVSCAPHTKETVKLFNESVFNRMKPTAYFINVSRGGLVDQEALVKALKEKKIAGAGLDVTTPEPLPSEHPLWDCPNLIITPHNSGMAPMRQVRLDRAGDRERASLFERAGAVERGGQGQRILRQDS